MKLIALCTAQVSLMRKRACTAKKANGKLSERENEIIYKMTGNTLTNGQNNVFVDR